MDALQKRLEQMEKQNPSPSLISKRSWKDKFRKFHREVEKVETSQRKPSFKGTFVGIRKLDNQEYRGRDNEEPQSYYSATIEGPEGEVLYQVETPVKDEIMRNYAEFTDGKNVYYGGNEMGHDVYVFVREKDAWSPNPEHYLSKFYLNGQFVRGGQIVGSMGGTSLDSWSKYYCGLEKGDEEAVELLVEALEKKTERKLIPYWRL